ncbi:MAG: DUF4961 domain-containing protein [Dysgonamonadaceae bacterium]|nr:DUF4961 domain-containing protein [Dysgonamonadaceae bacterium]
MRNIIAGISCLLLVGAVFFSCVYLDPNNPIEYASVLTADENATFIVNMYIESIEDHSSDMLIFSFLVPKLWNARQNTTITYTDTYDEGVVKSMSIIPVEVAPKNRQGMTWDEALKAEFGIESNVLDEMEWVTFQSDEAYDVHNGDKQKAKITVVTKVGPDNLRFKLGYFINHSNDGLGDASGGHWKHAVTDCIEVVDGEGETLDFCELHLNAIAPRSATKDDIITIKFQGDVESNDLDSADEIYLVAKAFTGAFHEYPVTERTAKTRMSNEKGKTYSLTFWAADYFGIPANEEILRIEYYFTNADGSKSVMQTYETGEPDTWFLSTFSCK